MADKIAGVFEVSIWRWWKERRQIEAFQAEEREALVKMRKAVEEAKRNGATGGETREIEEELIWPVRSASDAIDVIKCSQLIRKALRYSLPLPPKPGPPMYDSDCRLSLRSDPGLE